VCQTGKGYLDGAVDLVGQEDHGRHHESNDKHTVVARQLGPEVLVSAVRVRANLDQGPFVEHFVRPRDALALCKGAIADDLVDAEPVMACHESQNRKKGAEVGERRGRVSPTPCIAVRSLCNMSGARPGYLCVALRVEATITKDLHEQLLKIS
jgi:hypothetical protein